MRNRFFTFFTFFATQRQTRFFLAMPLYPNQEGIIILIEGINTQINSYVILSLSVPIASKINLSRSCSWCLVSLKRFFGVLLTRHLGTLLSSGYYALRMKVILFVHERNILFSLILPVLIFLLYCRKRPRNSAHPACFCTPDFPEIG